MKINTLVLKRLFSEIDHFNKKSRTLLLRPLISFVVSWTQSLIECNVYTMQLHPTHLTQGPIAHCYFWEGRQARFPVLSFSPHSTFSWWGSYQAITVASQGVRHQPAAVAILEPHENHEWRSGLAVNGLYHRDKASIQRAPLCSAKCADNAGRPGDPLYDGELQPLHGRSSPNSAQIHDQCICRYTVCCNALPEVCKLNPTHHLLSLSVLWQHSSCRGTWPPLNSELMTVLWQPGQFTAFGNSLPSFFNHDQQQISCFIGCKTVNYHNAVAEDIPFIWQKIEINLT